MAKTAELKTAEQRLLEAIESVEIIEYQNPGEGATLFAAQFMAGYTIHNAMPVVQQIMSGFLHDTTDKKVKRCAHCAYYFHDRTKNNSAVVCSLKCRNLKKATYTRAKNAAKPKKPKKPNNRDRYYNSHYEYPHWSNEYEMLKQSWKHEMSYPTDKVERIIAAKIHSEEMHGRKKKPEIIVYNGDEGTSRKVYVKFPTSDKSEWPVTVTTMVAGELEERYTSKTVSEELRRSYIFEREPWGKSQYMR